MSNIIVMAFSPRNIMRCFLKENAYNGGVTGTPGSPLATALQSGKVHVKWYFRTLIGKGPGAPNDGFLSNAVQRCFRLSGVLLKLCRLIIGCARAKRPYTHVRTCVSPEMTFFTIIIFNGEKRL